MLTTTLNLARRVIIVALAIACALFAARTSVAAGEPAGLPVADVQRSTPVDFEKEIRPILQRNCIACHNRSEAESDVVLESPQDMLAAETDPPLLVAGSGEKSQLFLVASHRSDSVMPPDDNDVGAKNLTPNELGLLRLWIDQGAKASGGQSTDAVPWQRLAERLTPIYAVAVAPRGDLVAAGRANRIHLYNVQAKRHVAELTDPSVGNTLSGDGPAAAHLDLVQSLAFSPDGERLGSGGYQVAKIWRRSPPAPTVKLGQVENATGALAAAGELVAVAVSDGTIRLFEVAQQKIVGTLEGHTDAVASLAFSADGSRLASAGRDQKCRIWDIKSGQLLGEIDIPSPVESVVWAANDTRIVTGCADAVIRVWTAPGAAETTDESAPPKPLAGWQGHAGPVTHLAAIDKEGTQVVSVGTDGTLRIWNVAENQQLRQLSHGGPVSGVAISDDGKHVISVGENKIVRVFHTDNGQQVAESRTGHVLRRQVEAARWEMEVARRYTTAAAADLKTAENRRKTAQDEIKKAEEEVKQAETDLAAKAEAVGKAKENEKEKAEATKKIAERTLQASKDRLARLKTAAADADRAVTDAQAAIKEAEGIFEQLQARLSGLEQKAAEGERALACVTTAGSTGAAVVADDEGRLHLFDVATGAALSTSNTEPAPVVSLRPLPNGQLVTLGRGGQLELWSTAPSWRLERVLGTEPGAPAPVDRVTSVAFSPDGKLVATGGGEPSRSGEIIIWDADTGKVVRTIAEPHSDTVLELAFSPRGKYLASCGADRQMKVFEVATGDHVCTCEGHTHHVLAVAWRADGRMLATGGADKAVKIWEFPSGEQKRAINGFGKEVTSLDFQGLTENIVVTAGNAAVTTKTSSGGGGPTYSGSSGFVYCSGSSADGKTIAAGGERGILWIWAGGTSPMTFPTPMN